MFFFLMHELTAEMQVNISVMAGQEKEDIRNWINQVIAKNRENGKTIVMGQSMGVAPL